VPKVDVSDARTRLARRLRELRRDTWPGHSLTQGQVAQALGVSVPLISSWENVTAPKVPPPERLAAYALLFALERFPDGGDVPDERDLNEAERSSRARLEQEFLELSHAGPSTDSRSPARASLDSGFWQFQPGMDVSIVCAPLPEDLRQAMPYADPRSPDYVELLTYTDHDALFELYGHIRAVNPYTQVNLRLASELRDDDYTAHLVVLGGVDWNILTRDLLAVINVPVVPATRLHEWAEFSD
jgi:transcriptional regulator with XRE-family HTH domain